MERSLVLRRWGRVAAASVVLVIGLVAILEVRGAGAAPAGVSPGFLCAAPGSGELSYRAAGCQGSYRTVDLAGGPVDACASIYTGQLRLAQNGGCPSGHRAVEIGAGVDAAACANRYTGKVSYRHSAAQACNGVALYWESVIVRHCIEYCPQILADKSTLHTPLWFNDVSGTITDVNVMFDIEHTSITDLEIELESPSGTIVELYAHNCYNAVDDLLVTFDDEAPTLIGSVCPPNGGRFRPAPGALSAFDGEELNGTWVLRLADTIQGDTGWLHDWSIEIETN